MQSYPNGYRPGDPLIQDPHPSDRLRKDVLGGPLEGHDALASFLERILIDAR
jgi:hypothetical protein